MRWWIRSQALELGLCGHAANLGDGRVEVVAEGASAACTELVARLREEPSQRERPGRVSSVVVRDGAARGRESGFVER
jgi:acylphosphatase